MLIQMDWRGGAINAKTNRSKRIKKDPAATGPKKLTIGRDITKKEMAMSVRILPDTCLLSQLFDYDKESGWLFWKSRPLSMFVDKRSFNIFNTQFAGERAGSIKRKQSGNCYIEINLLGKSTLAHRIVWKLHYGTEPPLIIDHVDGDGTNNKIENLREATIHQNGWNAKKSSRNNSGYKGVSFNTEKNKWRAAIHVNGKTRLLGYFSSPEEASEAYKKASMELHGVFLRIV